MVALDIAVFLLLGALGARGFLIGFVRESLSLVAVVAGIVAVRAFHEPVAALLASWLGGEYAGAMLAFALTFGAVYIGIKLLAGSIAERVRNSGLGMVDRMLGLGFGVVKGILIASLLYVGFAIVYDALYGEHEPRPEWMRDARSFPLLNAGGEAISGWVARSSKEGGLIGASTGGDDIENEGAPTEAGE